MSQLIRGEPVQFVPLKSFYPVRFELFILWRRCREGKCNVDWCEATLMRNDYALVISHRTIILGPGSKWRWCWVWMSTVHGQDCSAGEILIFRWRWYLAQYNYLLIKYGWLTSFHASVFVSMLTFKRECVFVPWLTIQDTPDSIAGNVDEQRNSQLKRSEL